MPQRTFAITCRKSIALDTLHAIDLICENHGSHELIVRKTIIQKAKVLIKKDEKEHPAQGHINAADSVAIFPDWGRNMDTPLHSRDKGIVKKVGFRKWTCSEEGKDGEIGPQGDGHSFLRCTRNHLHRLLGKRTNVNCRVLCVVIAPVERRNQEKTFSFEKDKDPLASRQCTSAHLCSFDGQNYGIKLQIITTSTVFTGLTPHPLPPVLNDSRILQDPSGSY